MEQIQDTAGLIDRLEEAMRRIAGVIYDLDDEEYTETPSKDAWSPIQIFAHLKACDDLTTPRIAQILTASNPTLFTLDLDRWQALAGYADAPVEDTLAEYQRHRAETVWQLRRLPAEAWTRVGQHPTRGEETLYDVLRKAAEHEEEHIAELERILEHFKARDKRG